ncbi:MAG: hypothetical protein JWQ84_1112 [Mucilaginibacter sp.]|nr:hypothetical protein [Mucilaginibacter sp.]MDB5016280.1 hypothetical protein [Mucilaginibacter sp.]MDB5138565.1 hypothetical protein [Mucilaginibacter sp.]
MKYLKVILLATVAVFTFGSTMAQDRGGDHHRNWRHHRWHHRRVHRDVHH